MRVLFLTNSEIWIHTLPAGFLDAGHTVRISGPLSEQTLPALISGFNPHLAISMGWGSEQSEQNQELIRDCTKAAQLPHVYWSTEDKAFTRTFSLPLVRRMRPEFVFSISRQSVGYFKRNGFSSAYMDFGYAPKIHHYAGRNQQYQCAVAVVANAYPHVLKTLPDHYRHDALDILVGSLLKEGIRVDFWGRDWDKMRPFGLEIPRDWIHGYLPYVDCNMVYSSASIVIGLQNYPDQLTQRTYEILASGGCLLTLDSPGITRLFEPGRDLIASSTARETSRLVRQYLRHPKLRRMIAHSGQASVLPHSYKNRALYMLKVLKREKIL